MEGKELISTVIVNYNGAALLRACLRSVFAQPYRPIEVLVVDNASIDESCEIVKGEFPEARLIELKRNTGFAEGNNIGVRQARGDLIALLNNDAEVAANWLPPLVELLESPGVGIAASKIVTDGVPDAFYEMNGTINYTGYNIMRQFEDLSKIFYAGGTSLMFRRSVAGDPFPDEYFLYHEDAHFSWRMRLQGFDVRMSQNSVVSHRGSVSTKREASTLITFYQTRNRLLNVLLMYEALTIFKLLPLLAVDLVLTLVQGVLSPSKSLVGVLRAYGWIIFNPLWIKTQRGKLQALRRVPDESIMSLMSSDIVDEARTGLVAMPFNLLARLYARIIGLRFHA